MVNILKSLWGKRLFNQSGFTLVELLVVVGIVVALAAVVVPQVARFADRGDQGAAVSEWDAIQRSVEALMSDQELSTVTAGASAAFITNTLDFDPGAGAQNLTNYMRDVTTSYCYTWDGTGSLLTQVEATGSPAACP